MTKGELEVRSNYEEAVAKNDAAILRFWAAREAYTAREIGDDEFLAARAVYDAAMKEFDIAFAKDQNK